MLMGLKRGLSQEVNCEESYSHSSVAVAIVAAASPRETSLSTDFNL